MENNSVRYEIFVKTSFSPKELDRESTNKDYDFWVNAHHAESNINTFYESYSEAFEVCKQFWDTLAGFKIIEILEYNGTKYYKTLYKTEGLMRYALKFNKS